MSDSEAALKALKSQPLEFLLVLECLALNLSGSAEELKRRNPKGI